MYQMVKQRLLNKIVCLFFSIFIGALLYNAPINAAEYKINGIIDIRATATDSLDKSYLAAGQGKLGKDNGSQLSIAQAGAEMSVNWDNGISAHGIINAYANKGSDNEESMAIGFTEAYLKYRAVPNTAGYRLQVKTGIFYPEISIENNAYAWASRDTLNSSMLNTWLGEEVRVLGAEFKLTRLGRINNNNFDLSLSASLFANNDPAGALLSWHGWTMGSRQTLWTEKREIPWFPAREPGGDLAEQAAESDPFLEIDHRLGYHIRGEWLLHRKGAISAGYYDNKAIPYKVTRGQYGWGTSFYHLEMKWRLAKNVSLMTQYLSGKTLMQAADKHDVVNNDYATGFIALTYKWHAWLGNNKHKTTGRIERFLVTDNDKTIGDNNNENGHALTLNHSYRLTKHWFLSSEINLIDSHRPARIYENQEIDLIEKQLQLAVRYFF